MDELLKIDGIGKATAQKLFAAGYASAATLAVANAATPIDGVKPEDWAKWIEAAKALPAPEVPGPSCISRVNLNGTTYEIGKALPADLDDTQLAELRDLGVID